MLYLRERWQSSSSYYGSTCEEYKPCDQRLQRQGVEVIQLINRCRGNYQQGCWDEASTLLSLFEAAEWQNLRQLRHSSSTLKDDKYTRLQKHVSQRLHSDADMGARGRHRHAVWLGWRAPQSGVADVRQSLQDAGERVCKEGQAGEAGDATMLQYAYHVMDIWLTWGDSVIKGMMDVAQIADFENCKLPDVDTGLQSLGLCACGDEQYAIPAAEKRKTWTQHASWYSGLLMLNEGDGSNLIVWNPYSLQQLLALKGDKGQGYADFVLCLRERWQSSSSYYGSTCEEYKPRDQRLQRQGVEVLKLISRCRGNYQQGHWDEASTLLTLVEAAGSGRERNKQ